MQESINRQRKQQGFPSSISDLIRKKLEEHTELLDVLLKSELENRPIDLAHLAEELADDNIFLNEIASYYDIDLKDATEAKMYTWGKKCSNCGSTKLGIWEVRDGTWLPLCKKCGYEEVEEC